MPSRETPSHELLATQLRVVIDALPDAVAVHRAGVFVFVNSATARILGYRPEEMIGRSVVSVVHPAEREEVTARIQALLRTGEAAPVREERFIAKDGRVIVSLARAMPVVWEGADAVMVIAQDVTELRRYEERLAMTDRLASVGTLAAGMAHDLNNPLASLVLALDLAREIAGPEGEIGREEAARIRERIDGALIAAERLKEIVGDLRVFARQPEEAERLIDVTGPVRSALDLARNEIRHRCRVETAFAEAPLVLASEGRMVQVFLNLVMNAIQAFPEDRPPEANLLRVSCKALPTSVRVSVEDNGVGIPADQVHRVFEPYFTTKPAGKGTGLGLWMVHGVVQRLGGRVVLRSEPERGTRVEVFLPIGAVKQVPPEAPVVAPVGRRRVLIVDDEPEIADLVAEVLRAEHDVQVHTRGRAALDAILRDPPDIIVCDLMMPDLSGRELYDSLVADGRGFEGRLVFATGGAFTSSASDFLQQVSVPVLHKPFRLSAVRALVARWPARTA